MTSLASCSSSLNIPGLSLRTLKKYPPQYEATAMGHLDQVRKNKQSTKKSQKQKEKLKSDPFAQENMESIEDAFPKGLEDGKKTHQCYVAMYNIEATGKVYTDQSGRFPVTSSQGNTQLFIMYDYHGNYIKPVLMKKQK